MLINGKAHFYASGLNRILERFLPLLTPFGLALGLTFTSFFLKVRPFVPMIFGIATLSGAINMKIRDMGVTFSRPIPIFSYLLFSRLIMPPLVYVLGRIVFGNDIDTISGNVLLYAAPTAVSGLIWITIYKGNIALSLGLIMLDTMLAPLVVPMTIRLLLGAAIQIETFSMILSLFYMVVLPTIAGIILNETSRGKAPRIAGPFLAPLAKICLVTVISANSAAAASHFDFSNLRFWIIAAAGVGFSVIGFILGKFAGALCSRINREDYGRETQISLFFGVGLHNISAAMTLAIRFFPPAAAVPAIVGIIFQQIVCAVMGRLFYKETTQ